ncbi:MAG: hypothetical protein IH802_08945 [Nitrospinae bacterium]|nr:hypothetical protein [Nitrospinota bacterium]
MSDIVKNLFLRIFDMSDIAKSFVVLIVSVILVHLAYIGYVRPEADLLLEAAKQASQSAPRDLVIVLKDYEQEICIILMLWGSFLILSKCRTILRSKYLYTVDIIEEIKVEAECPQPDPRPEPDPVTQQGPQCDPGGGGNRQGKSDIPAQMGDAPGRAEIHSGQQEGIDHLFGCRHGISAVSVHIYPRNDSTFL